MDYARLQKLMMLATSENDHEALSALRKATFLVRQAGFCWADLLRPMGEPHRNPPVHQPPPWPPEKTELEMKLEWCLAHCTGNSKHFIEGLENSLNKYGFLTNRQMDCLDDTYRAWKEGRKWPG